MIHASTVYGTPGVINVEKQDHGLSGCTLYTIFPLRSGCRTLCWQFCLTFFRPRSDWKCSAQRWLWWTSMPTSPARRWSACWVVSLTSHHCASPSAWLFLARVSALVCSVKWILVSYSFEGPSVSVIVSVFMSQSHSRKRKAMITQKNQYSARWFFFLLADANTWG